MISLRDVSKTYKLGNTEITALKHINLDIANGDMIVISGPSGSGKSTLLNMLGVMDSPTEGTITIDDEEITHYSPNRLTGVRARKIGFVFQNFNLIPALNVFENIVVPMKLKGWKYDKKAVIGLIEKVGLDRHMKHKPDELSGGQRQRVAIARALIHNPPYIFADEPTANLDSKTSETIVQLLQDINLNYGVTIIYASHDERIVKGIKKKIFLKDGEIHQ